MKLGTKIFFYITVFFSAAFLVGGYVLISYFYEITMDREITSAVERYQYNKFVVEANLITRGQDWLSGVEDGIYDMEGMAMDLSDTSALFTVDQKMLFSDFPKGAEFSGLLADVTGDRVDYRFAKMNGRMYLLTAGIVAHGAAEVCLVTGTEVEKALEQHKQIIRKFGMVYGVTMVIGAVLIFGLSNFLTKPVKQLTEATRKIADGNYKERVADTGSDEVGELARNFNRMALAVEEKVQELSDSAKKKEDFVANFAHELKTPLTSVIGYADRIYRKEMTRKEQKQAAWHIWNEGMRLEALSLKLMELATLEHGEFLLEEMRADELFRELAGDMEYLMEKRGVELCCSAQKAYIKVEYDLFKTLILNLVDNAVKAGAKHIWITGVINVRTAVSGNRDKRIVPGKRERGSVMPGKVQRKYYRVVVQDDGGGIPRQEIKRITEAFYMVDKSRSRKQHGAGIGLALADKIARLHGSTLKFKSDGQNGTMVSMCLKYKGVRDDEEG